MGPMMSKCSSISPGEEIPCRSRSSHSGNPPGSSGKIGPQDLFLVATISEYLMSSRSDNFGQLNHVVTKIPASFGSVPPHNMG
jgi:hypothetical protein